MTEIKSWICFFAIVLLLNGCKKQYLPNDGYIPEVAQIDAEEIKNVNFFACPSNFQINSTLLAAIDKLFKDIEGSGVENIGFMLVSNQAIPTDVQKEVKKQLCKIMYRHGFINSRIIDYGTHIYANAKVGIRIDVLTYDVKGSDCGPWKEYMGDTDTSKNLPKYGAAHTYNTVEMVSNKADFVSPREYRGQETKSAIAVIGANGGSGG
jgi:type IV pilus biogenesis protein CpaD/CtpE